MRPRSWMLCAIAAALLVGGSAIAAEDPTAAELLDRAKAGNSIMVDDTAQARPLLWSIGIGANQLSPLLEYDSYMGKTQTFGAYIGLGVRTASVGMATASLVTTHFGPSFRPDPYWRFGLGIEHHQAAASVGQFAVVVDEWGPHGWFELGMVRGFAVRTQVGTEGMGVTAHWRF